MIGKKVSADTTDGKPVTGIVELSYLDAVAGGNGYTSITMLVVVDEGGQTHEVRPRSVKVVHPQPTVNKPIFNPYGKTPQPAGEVIANLLQKLDGFINIEYSTLDLSYYITTSSGVYHIDPEELQARLEAAVSEGTEGLGSPAVAKAFPQDSSCG